MENVEIRYVSDADSISGINTPPDRQTPASEPVKPVGLTVVTTCVFIVGVIAGAGFLTLPKAVDDSGWIGFVLILFCCCMAAYTGDILGKCWNIVLERHPDLKGGQVRYPYPAIGYEAFGNWGRYIVSTSIHLTNFGGTVVYLLLASENIIDLLPSGTKFNCCYISLIIGAAMTPLTWLGTPKDFWLIAVAATLATSAASVILFGTVIYNGSSINIADVQHTDVDVVSFFMAYGTICFAFNGHSSFPTFQSDMANPKNFGKAIVLGFVIVMLMYLPSSVASYVVYGSKIKPNVLNTLPNGPANTIVAVLMTAHLLFGIVIVINPVTQELEHFLKIPEKFTIKRVFSRTLMLLAVMFVAASVPHFSSILSLVGGSTISILAFICPALFYLKLCRKDGVHKAKYIPLHIRVLLIEIIVVGIVAGVAATYSAITDLAVNKFTVPCYVNPTKACSVTG